MQGHSKIIEHFRNVLHMNINVNISMHQLTKLQIYFSVLFVGVAGLSFVIQYKDHHVQPKEKKIPPDRPKCRYHQYKEMSQTGLI